MIECVKCKQMFHTKRGMEQHLRKSHINVNLPDLIGMGVIKRKLTRKEAKEVTKEVMDLGIKDNNLRFNIALIKIADKVNS